jgi:membrane-bound metal-dependent hydrolase YbcI (DUF457 family)
VFDNLEDVLPPFLGMVWMHASLTLWEHRGFTHSIVGTVSSRPWCGKIGYFGGAGHRWLYICPSCGVLLWSLMCM